MKFFILDEREVWHEAACAAARGRGYEAKRIRTGQEVVGEQGLGFIRPHADPRVLEDNQHDFQVMDLNLKMIQDPGQVTCYEDKSLQFLRWGHLMPNTKLILNRGEALEFCGEFGDTVVSKANEGASSTNVRILKGLEAQLAHVREVFDRGVKVNPCSGGPAIVQNDYVLLQEFIPHTTTWRVNIVGRQLAGFMRYCYPDRAVAQTGNTDPILTMTPQVESLFDFARQVAQTIDTRWCALDILWHEAEQRWRLLETSLAWPWPGVGKQAPFFGTSRHWGEMWEVLFDEVEAGVWQ